MNIGIDARFWNETGVGRYTRNLLIELQKIDKVNQYSLFSISKNIPSIQKEITGKNFTITKADIKWHTIEEQTKFPKLLDKYQLDLMHFPYFSVPVFYNKPYIITIHDLILHHFPTGEASTLPEPIYKIKHTAYKMIIEKAAKNARKIIAVSNTTKDEIVNNLHVPSDKIIVTYEGVEKSIVRHEAIEERSNNILHVGNLYPHKNMDRVLDAMKLCIEKKIDLKIVIVGRKDFFYKKFYKKVLSLGLDKYFIFKGEVADNELALLYQESKATIIPSLMEGLGLPALESMANNCLVLASDIPSLREVCKDAAIYFDPSDASDIAKKIEMVSKISPSLMQEKIKVGYNRTKFFSWENMAKETLKAYESCIGIRQSK